MNEFRMNQYQCSGYLRDLGSIIREKALEAKKTSDATTDDSDRGFSLGRLMAFHEVVSLMQQQAEAFDISLGEIGLADINPEKDLL
jgi:hypothetical protein